MDWSNESEWVYLGHLSYLAAEVLDADGLEDSWKRAVAALKRELPRKKGEIKVVRRDGSDEAAFSIICVNPKGRFLTPQGLMGGNEITEWLATF